MRPAVALGDPSEGSRIALTAKEITDRPQVIDAALAEALEDESAGRVSPKFGSVAEFEACRK